MKNQTCNRLHAPLKLTLPMKADALAGRIDSSLLVSCLFALVLLAACAARKVEPLDDDPRVHTDEEVVVDNGQAPIVPEKSAPFARPPTGAGDPTLRFLEFPKRDDRVVANVGERTLSKSQIFDFMRNAYPRETKAALSVMISNQVIRDQCELRDCG